MKLSTALIGSIASVCFVSSVVSAQTATPKVGQDMLKAYEALMNDWDLLKGGQFGRMRLELDPSTPHRAAAREGKGEKVKGPNVNQKRLGELRRDARVQGISMVDMLIRKDSGKIVFHSGTRLRVSKKNSPEDELDRAAREAAKVLSGGSSQPFIKNLSNGVFTAMPIRFRSELCVSCHKGAKVNGVAAIAAVITAKRVSPISGTRLR